MSSITFMHTGLMKCPKCGTIGNSKKKDELKFFECPLCNTEFTDEVILTEGYEIELTNN